ncbi:pleckstrin homology domain-containing family B member 2 [Octopus sinensis]|uniref:Pleckstrin homology domain-containing family B member 2 n=1 Tax=Octopus sinensis TaxID=2607531 RepID=A0A6P7TAQ8_9MOLL|nr:pleckstrin homology domain-containing family B member 2 [Octopus sinensis]XP_036367365.1 pleckstrin homology domain-containing family B member 2 [Octopus sinensis]XP_036367366.1 pleckstrin homology domain-containing family B member 2 [Octopus sinensis]
MDYDIMKAGWMHRQSSILHRWKKNWFVLYKSGKLRYFESPHSRCCDDVLMIPSALVCIKTGKEVAMSNPLPSHLNRNCLIELVARDRRLLLCAESSDDTSAWKMAIEEARAVHATRRFSDTFRPDHHQGMEPPPSYAELYNQPQILTYATNEYPTGYSVHHVNSLPYGTRQIYVQEPYRERYTGCDVAMGVATGALVGSMLWSPFLWWW